MPKTAWETLLSTTKSQRGLVFLLWFFIFVGNGLGFLSPLFYKMIADYVASNSLHDFQWTEVTFPIIGILLCLVGTEIFYRIAHIMEIPVTLRAYSQATRSIYQNLLDRPSSYFEDRLSGELGRRVEQIGDGVKYFLSDFPWTAGWIIPATTVSAALLYVAHPLLFYYFGIWLFFFVATSYPLLRWQYSYAQTLSGSQAHLSGKMVDVLSNITIVHAFAAERAEKQNFGAEMDTVISAEKKERAIFVVNRFQQGMSIAALGTILLVGSLQLFSASALTVGDFLLVATLIPSLSGVIWSTGDAVLQTIRTYGKMADSVRDLQTDMEKMDEGSEALEVKEGGAVDFKNISFTYPGTDEAVFSDFHLRIEHGERVGIVGPSGGGKSTLIKLLLRHYDPESGSVMVGDADIKTVTIESLRQAIAFVPQDTTLFHRTLMENIQYAKPDATESEVFEASRRAHAHEFIEATPQGYATTVGERGVKLSGGQRQRIAIARAMLKNAPILVLDEATSSLDSQGEEVVQEGFHELFAGRTVIAIAHRLSTLREMDRIIVIHGGKVVEDGNPKGLLAQTEGIFKEMWEHQKGGFVG